MQLISTFPILPSESGLGWYRRLASDNMLSSWKELARECGVSVGKTGLFARPDYVARSLDLDPEWCREASLRDEVARGWRGLRRTKLEAVCVHCLAESPHMRLCWEHAYMVACPHHSVQLVCKCSACGEALSSTRERVDFCSCGNDLRAERTVPASPAQLWLASLIESSGASSGKWAPLVQGAGLDLVVMLVRTLCLLIEPGGVPAKQNSAPPRTLAEAIEFLRPLDGLLADWPKAFEAHVSGRIAAGTPEARTLNTRLGKWYLQLKALSDCPPLEPFLAAVGRVATAEFDGVLGLDRAAETITRDSPYVLVREAAQRMGMHRDTLASYAKQGQMELRVRKFGTTGTYYELRRAEVESVLEARAEWCSEAQASELMGVPLSTIERLKDEGLLRADASWRQDVRKGGPIELSSVRSLILKMLALPSTKRRPEEKVIALRRLTARRAGDGRAVGAALRAAFTGEILPVGKAGTVGDLEFHLAEVSKYFSRPVLEAGLSVEALAKATGWKWESISHWIDSGLMGSNTIMLRGQPCRVVMPDQLLAFCRSFIPLADVARELGTKSSALHHRLQGIEVVGSHAVHGGGQRGGLVRIGDLARASLDGRKNGGGHGAGARNSSGEHANSMESITA